MDDEPSMEEVLVARLQIHHPALIAPLLELLDPRLPPRIDIKFEGIKGRRRRAILSELMVVAASRGKVGNAFLIDEACD